MWVFYEKIDQDSSKTPSHKKHQTINNSTGGKKVEKNKEEDIAIECNIRTLNSGPKKARKFGRYSTGRI